jgi:hypothetical protein
MARASLAHQISSWRPSDACRCMHAARAERHRRPRRVRTVTARPDDAVCAHHRLHIGLPRSRSLRNARVCLPLVTLRESALRTRPSSGPKWARHMGSRARAVETHAWGCESGASGEPPMRGRRPHVCSPPQLPAELHARCGLRCAAPAMQWAAMETHSVRKPSGKSMATKSNPKSHRSTGGIKLWLQQCT